MPAGINAFLNKSLVDQTVGNVSQNLNKAMRDVESTKQFIDVHDDAALTALGYESGDIANIRSALADLDQLRIIYEGGAALAQAKNFRTFSQRLYGTGFGIPGNG